MARHDSPSAPKYKCSSNLQHSPHAVMHRSSFLASSKWARYAAVKTEEPFAFTDNGVSNNRNKLHRWKQNLILGCAAAVLVFAVNLGLFLWTRATHHRASKDGSIVLAAGNVCMQCLIAPTRDEIDKARAKSRWLDIGVNTVRNIKNTSTSRQILWSLLALSTVPLHLLYNSVLFEAKAVNDFVVAATPQSFVDGQPWNHTRAQCFGHVGFYQYFDPNVALMYLQNQSPLNETALNIFGVQGEEDISGDWICDGPEGGAKFCDTPQKVTNAADWVILGSSGPGIDYHEESEFCGMNRDMTFPVKHYLAQQTPESCQIGVSPIILAIVLACNLIKIICLLWTILKLDYEPLVTLGDAIASFLERTDQSTKGCGPMSVDLEGWTADVEKRSGIAWKAQQLTGLGAASHKRWLVCNLLLILVWIAGIVLLFSGFQELNAPRTFSAIVADGIGQLNVSLMVTAGGMPTTIMGNVVIANLPQLVISLLYLLYNDLFTRMQIAVQWSSYAGHYKKLRLLAPRKDSRAMMRGFKQRSQYTLSLPLRIWLPLLVAMMILHWLVSQSIFLAILGVQDYTSGSAIPVDRGYPVLGLGWSPFAIILSLILGGLMVMGLWAYTSTVRLGRTMPVVRTCSAAISAACHPPVWDFDAAEKAVAYGVIQTHLIGQNSEKIPRHATFTSLPVEALVDGELYS